MRIVGNKDFGLTRSPATPEEAWRRGRVLDAMLPDLARMKFEVSRLSHARRNAIDDARMLHIARQLNSAPFVDGKF